MTVPSSIQLPPGLFVTATGTASGKTFVTRGLAAASTERGRRVAALKPIETGMPADLAARGDTDCARLAHACGRPELADAPGFYRAELPAAPYAVSLATGSAAPDLEQLALAVARAAEGSDAVLVEGAGGLLVPIDRRHTTADLIVRLGLPILLVAPNALGVLSHALTAVESAMSRGLKIAALVLVELAPSSDTSDPSRPHNAAILAERVAFPVRAFPFCADTSDRTLARAALSADLAGLL